MAEESTKLSEVAQDTTQLLHDAGEKTAAYAAQDFPAGAVGGAGAQPAGEHVYGVACGPRHRRTCARAA